MKVNFVMMSENMSNQPQVSQPLALFRTALLHGWLHKLWARLTRRCFYLEELGETPGECLHTKQSLWRGQIDTHRPDPGDGGQGRGF
jgi:hypothetical protein